MRHLLASVVLAVSAVVGAACGGTATSPSSITPSPGDPTIGFNGLTVNGASVSTYTESGFTVSTKSGNWSVRTDYGHPAPFIQFWASGGTTVTGEIRVTATGSPFYFSSVDLYSSTTPIPYMMTGIRNSSTVFTVTDTLPNTFGDFRTVVNPHAADAIDTLSIALTNSAAACCRNPMGLDSIVVSLTPSTAPTTPAPTPAPTPTPTPTPFTLSGQVTDSLTGSGISGATVSIPTGRNGGQSTTTDAAGSYSLTLQPPPSGVQALTVINVSSSSYAPQTKDVTFTSNQSNETLSFQLVRANTTITFGGLTAIGSAVSAYTESGFTVSPTSGGWTVDAYGNPGPSIIFTAPAGSTGTGTIQVTAGGAAFSFGSIELYSSTTPIPYTITGLRNSTTAFTMAATLPNTFGNFVTVVNPQAPDVIDRLVISLSNPAPCPTCSNPMGVDNIAVTSSAIASSRNK